MVELLKVPLQNDFRICLEAWKADMGWFVSSSRNYFEGDNM